MIYTVQVNDTIYSIAHEFSISPDRIIYDNQLDPVGNLAIGQSLLLLRPAVVHTVTEGETLASIAGLYGIAPIDIVRKNPYLSGISVLEPGTSLTIAYIPEDEVPVNERRQITTNGYAYPFISRNVLLETLPYLTRLSIFSYGFTPEGELIPCDDEELLTLAEAYNVDSILVLTPTDANQTFSNYLINRTLANTEATERLIENLRVTALEKGYAGVDVDFEYILAEDREPFTQFVSDLTTALNADNLYVSVALAPKESGAQVGLLYEAVDYPALGAAANIAFLMTYEWGYRAGPPMAVAPINKVRQIIDYATSVIPSEKIEMGVPNYAYDWPLPYIRGTTRATIISNPDAPHIAFDNNVPVSFDETAQSPYFFYTLEGTEHEVWFEDPRSINAKLNLLTEYDLLGNGYWNIMRSFRANWLLLNSRFAIYRD